MRRYLILVLVVVLVLLLTGGWWLNETGSTRSQEIRVGLYDNHPKVYRDTQGQPAGLFVELLQGMARREGWQLNFVDCKWHDCLKRLESGDIDLMPDVVLNEARDLRFDFHRIPVTQSWSEIWSQPGLRLLALPHLDGLRIAVLRSEEQQRALKQMMAGFDLEYTTVLVDSLAEGFEAVAEDRADVVVSNSYFAGINGPHYKLRETPIVFDPASLYYATPEGKNSALLERIDFYLERWRQDAESPYFTALKNAMVRPHETLMPESVRWILGVVITLVLLLFIMSTLMRREVRRRTTELDMTNRRFDHLLRTSPVVLYQLQVSEAGIVKPLWISENLPRLFGYKPLDVFQPNWWQQTIYPDDLDAARNGLVQVQHKGHMVHEYRIFDADGQLRYIRDEMQYLPDKTRQQGEIVGSWSDLTESHEQAASLRYLANYDSLTGLPNRTLLYERLSETLQRSHEAKHRAAVLYIDLDSFKNINETMGFAFGDQLLTLASERMKNLLRAGDTLARTGSDEFIMVVEDASAEVAAETAHHLLQRFSVPLVVDDDELVVTLSIGISLYPDDGGDHETLLRHAEIALNAAKNEGRNSLYFFSSSLSEGIRERLLLENDLRHAVERNQLVLHYQPQIDLHSGRLVGVEALLRWEHHQLGILSPDRFIPLAEQTGIIGEVGSWVLQEACRQIIQWDREDCYIPRVGVNLAVQQIESGLLVRQVKAAMQQAGIQGERLELEVTESTIMREPDKATEAMNAFRNLGIKLTIDDFGTGYSSLAYLKRLPLDRLKIDRSFVMDIGAHSGNEAICRTIINLAHSLGLETVAEGVEEQHHADFLKHEGCDIAQGYFYSKPLPPDELAEHCKAMVKKC